MFKSSLSAIFLENNGGQPKPTVFIVKFLQNSFSFNKKYTITANAAPNEWPNKSIFLSLLLSIFFFIISQFFSKNNTANL
ncbi:hypothetical protein A0H76_559 [Hepatospora eriocheir]|uniref:Uncharacterized protein n=1 Tax=Hepatospora eriocheir TaxID=1081669 RepID=A0A1X0Q8B1_9MICR|nr:hypothetical protein A0H76_559 [Hepatospora eriocheir]